MRAEAVQTDLRLTQSRPACLGQEPAIALRAFDTAMGTDGS